MVYRASITWIPKSDKDITIERKSQTNFTDEHKWKNTQQNICELNSRIQQKDHSPWLNWLYSRDAGVYVCIHLYVYVYVYI